MNPWLARNLVYRPATWSRGEPVFSLLRRFNESQWWDVERLEGHQRFLLQRCLRHALRASPFHAARARAAGIDARRAEAADLTRLPLLTKTDLVEHGHALSAPRFPGTTSWKTTGGSTGVAVRLRKSRYATACEQAASWRSYSWYGISPGDRQARFWGTPLTARARRRFAAIDFVLNRERFSAFAFRREDLRGYFDRLVMFRAHWAYGYVSMLAQFSEYCLEERLPLAALGLRAVVTTSEVLSDGDRALISRAFGAPVYNEYGCGEVGAVLYECERGRLHAMAENLVLELLPDPTPDEPAACRLIVTDLHNRATPLLRYDLGDRVVAAEGRCPCGRALPTFERVFGRAYDFLEAQDGTRFHGEFFLYSLEAARDRGLAVRQAQFVEIAPGEMEIRLVPGTGAARDAADWLATEVAARSAGRFLVRSVLVDEIPREASGKIRLIRRLTPRVTSTVTNG